MPEQLQAAVVRPLEVVEDQAHRPVEGQARQQVHHGREQLEPLGVGVDGAHRGESEQPRDEAREEGAQLRTVLVDDVTQLVLGRMAHVVAE